MTAPDLLGDRVFELGLRREAAPSRDGVADLGQDRLGAPALEPGDAGDLA